MSDNKKSYAEWTLWEQLEIEFCFWWDKWGGCILFGVRSWHSLSSGLVS